MQALKSTLLPSFLFTELACCSHFPGEVKFPVTNTSSLALVRTSQ